MRYASMRLRREPDAMKITEAKKRLLLAMLEAEPNGREALDRAMRKADADAVCYLSLCQYGMVDAPGVLTDTGRALAQEIKAAEAAVKPGEKHAPDFAE